MMIEIHQSLHKTRSYQLWHIKMTLCPRLGLKEKQETNEKVKTMYKGSYVRGINMCTNSKQRKRICLTMSNVNNTQPTKIHQCATKPPENKIMPRGYKTWVHSQTQNKVQWLATCRYVSSSSQSLRFILSLKLYSSFITSGPCHQMCKKSTYSETCLKRPLKNRQNKGLKDRS